MSEDIEDLVFDYNDFSALFIEIEFHLRNFYVPVQDPKEAELHFSTFEIWEKLFAVFPNKGLTQEVVASMLQRIGFKFYDFGEMRWEWMMKKV